VINRMNLIKSIKILELTQYELDDLTLDDLKKKFRELAKKYHPDKNKNDPDAEKRFKEINEAYDVVKKYLEQKEKIGSFGFSGFGFEPRFSHSDMMKQMFLKQRSIIEKVISIEDLLTKKSITIEYSVYKTCTACSGAGCSKCDGGFIIENKSIEISNIDRLIDGGRYVLNDSHELITSSGLKLQIPISVIVRFQDYDKKEDVRRKGNDIIKVLKVDFVDIVKLNTGSKYKFKLYNREYQFGLNDIQQSSIKYKFNGIPGSFGSSTGDLIVVLDINFDISKIKTDKINDLSTLINKYINNQNSKTN